MPATSKAQQRFMGMELAKKRSGQKTDVKMSERQLKDFAGTKLKGLPGHVKDKKVGKGQAAPPKPGYGQGEMGPPRPTEPPSAPMEQMRSTYGPYDPPGYGPQPMQSPPAPTYMPPSDGQVPGQGGPSSPIDQEIQRLLMMKQQQIQQGQQALQGQMGGQQPQPPQQPMGGAPGMGQALPPGMAPPPIGTGLQTMPLGGKPLQDPMISSSMSPGIASRALGGPPPLGPPPISGMPPKPPMPGGPPSLGAKPAPKKGVARAKKVRGKPRPAAGGRGERKGKTGIGQAGAASCDSKDKKKVGMGQAGAPAGAGQLAANDPYMMVKGRPYEQMPNGMLAPMVSPSTGQEAQAPQQPAQATAQPVGPPPQQGGVAPMGMSRPPAPPAPMPPAGVGMGQGDPTIGGALASSMGGQPSPPSWMAQTTLGAPTPQPPNPRPSPAPLYQGPPQRRPSYYPNDRPPLGQGQSMPPGGAINTGVPSPAAGSTPAAGGIQPMGMSRPRTDVPGLSGPSALGGGVGGGLGRPAVPTVGLGQSSKKSAPMKAAKKVGYR